MAQRQPSEAAIAKVRALDARTSELNAYARRADVAMERRKSYDVERPLPVRRATEAEIVEAALALDAGQLLNPRLWMERMTVRAAQVRAA
ncbi:MAG: hypothetical protein JWQ97_3548 [Phenylobacterium sp.]|nr:hypothetical protein [Phenylobacterium sp.]